MLSKTQRAGQYPLKLAELCAQVLKPLVTPISSHSQLLDLQWCDEFRRRCQNQQVSAEQVYPAESWDFHVTRLKNFGQAAENRVCAAHPEGSPEAWRSLAPSPRQGKRGAKPHWPARCGQVFRGTGSCGPFGLKIQPWFNTTMQWFSLRVIVDVEDGLCLLLLWLTSA